MNNHNVCGGRHSMRAILNWFDSNSKRWCWFVYSLFSSIMLWLSCNHQAKHFHFVIGFRNNIWVCHLAKMLGLNTNDNIQLLTLFHAHSMTNKVSQSVSSTLLAHVWLSSNTSWQRVSHWESVLDDPTIPCCLSRFLRIWFLDFQSSTWATDKQ